MSESLCTWFLYCSSLSFKLWQNELIIHCMFSLVTFGHLFAQHWEQGLGFARLFATTYNFNAAKNEFWNFFVFDLTKVANDYSLTSWLNGLKMVSNGFIFYVRVSSSDVVVLFSSWKMAARSQSTLLILNLVSTFDI